MDGKFELIKKMSDPSNRVVLGAVNAVREQGWLADGSLAYANLRFSHLQHANLSGADLRKANFNLADLRWVNLSRANLSGARLTRANLFQADFQGAILDDACLMGANLQGARNLEQDQLCVVHSLLGAILPDGSCYDGRYKLVGDLDCARVRGVNLDDPAASANFYGIAEPNMEDVNNQETGLHGNSIEQLIRKLRSSDQKLVSRAVEELRKRGRLSDGTLVWANLRYVHLVNVDLSTTNLQMADLSLADLRCANLAYARLEGTRLYQADLSRANFHKTEIKGANLCSACLQGAQDLGIEQLLTASRLRGAMMPDGSRYDGRFNLPGDLRDAHCLGINLQSPAVMAGFYGITIQDYENGQAWADANLPGTRSFTPEVYEVDAESFLTRLSEQGFSDRSGAQY